MPFYVYIIRGIVDDSYYKDFTINTERRLALHDDGETKNTRHLRPWKMVYVEIFYSKALALKRENPLNKQIEVELMP